MLLLHMVHNNESRLRLLILHAGAARQLHIVERSAGLQMCCCSILSDMSSHGKQAMPSAVPLQRCRQQDLKQAAPQHEAKLGF